MRKLPELQQVASDQQIAARISPSRSTATPPIGSGCRLTLIDQTLYDAFGQRQVATIYTATNQYKVVLEVATEVPERSKPAVANLPIDVRPARRCR